MHKRQGFTPLEVNRIRKWARPSCGVPELRPRTKIRPESRERNHHQPRAQYREFWCGVTGFTLIELLVVIAIIALLMGILVPVLRKVREQGKDVVCRNNLRQIGMGANFYAAAYDMYIPRSAEWGGNIKPWFQLFMPFLAQKAVNDDYRNVEIFRCPSYPDKEQTVCYVVNGWRSEAGDNWIGRSKLTDCHRPAFTIYLADNEDGPWRTIIKKASDRDVTRCDVFRLEHLPSSDSQGITGGRRVARARHKNGCNVLFLDWHVDWMAAEDMTVDMWRFEK